MLKLAIQNMLYVDQPIGTGFSYGMLSGGGFLRLLQS